MSKLRMPYQCLQKCGNILIAGRGSSIDLFSLEDRSLLSTWKCPPLFQDLKISGSSKKTSSPSSQATESEPSPAKKRKLSADQNSEMVEVRGESKKSNNRADAVNSGLEAPAVTALVVKDQHVIAVTGEDKSIRVFENVKENGKHILKHISQR
jgi:tRNA (guanine-N(7)-)-methyltransferase subunit TRM82